MKNDQELIQEDLNEIRGLLYDVGKSEINLLNDFDLEGDPAPSQTERRK